MRRFLQALAALALSVPLAGQAAASCRINLTVTINKWWNDTTPMTGRAYGRQGLRVGGRFVTTDHAPFVEIELQTQRRVGGWEHAVIHPRPGHSSEARGVQPEPRFRPGSDRPIYGHRITRLSSGDGRTLPSRIALVADLDGAGCIADRQFRILTRCGPSQTGELQHLLLHRRNYRALAQRRTDVSFGGSRVAPQAITHAINCPHVGPLRRAPPRGIDAIARGPDGRAHGPAPADPRRHRARDRGGRAAAAGCEVRRGDGAACGAVARPGALPAQAGGGGDPVRGRI
jgi:hypothetical protein